MSIMLSNVIPYVLSANGNIKCGNIFVFKKILKFMHLFVAFKKIMTTENILLHRLLTKTCPHPDGTQRQKMMFYLLLFTDTMYPRTKGFND